MNAEFGYEQCHNINSLAGRCPNVPVKVLRSMCVHEHDLDSAACTEHVSILEQAQAGAMDLFCTYCSKAGHACKPSYFGIENINQEASA